MLHGLCKLLLDSVFDAGQRFRLGARMPSFAAFNHNLKILTRRLLAALCVALLLGASAPMSAQTPAGSSARDPARAAEQVLDELFRGGKLNRRASLRLKQRIADRGAVRVLVRLKSDDPLVLRSPRQLRSKRARHQRRAAIARKLDRFLSRPQMRGLRGLKRMRHMPVIALEADAQTLQALRESPDVLSVHEDKMLRPFLNSSNPQLGADEVWAQGFDGLGQTVAVIDSGVDAQHVAFGSRVVAEACFSTRSLIESTTSLCPAGSNPNAEDSQIGPGAAQPCENTLGCDHGTHVAGIAASEDQDFQGMAANANIIAVQVFSQVNNILTCGFQPTCLSAHTSDLIRGLEHIYDLRDTHTIAAVNMSLGAGAYTSVSDCEADYPLLNIAVNNLRAAGIAVIAASGNDGYINALAAPACLSGAFSVGAVDDFDEVGYFSNAADFLDLLAPGLGVVSTIPGGGFAYKDGTSMASPHVAGAIASLRQAAPNATPEEVFNAINASGIDVFDPRSSITKPRLQVDAALDRLLEGSLDAVDIGLEQMATGFSNPSRITHAGDGSGRLFIAQSSGEIRIVDSGVVQPIPFLDLSAVVSCCDEPGLIGLAFDPNFSSNGRFYVSYIGNDGKLVVARYQSSSDLAYADSNSAEELLSITIESHSAAGGGLVFGFDGMLYIGVGVGSTDPTLQNIASDISDLRGKLLRLDVSQSGSYTIPADNPYVGIPAAREEIWSSGLHLPQGLTIDSFDGQLFIADSGSSTFEEINNQTANSSGGENYGWAQMEGDACANGIACDPAGLALPIGGYPKGDGCAISSGAVHRDSTFVELNGALLFADQCNGQIQALRASSGGWTQRQLLQTNLPIAALGVDEQGAAYVIESDQGTLFRVVQSHLDIDGATLADAYLERPYAHSFSATAGEGALSWQLVGGQLPDGLSLDASGVISGQASEVGVFSFVVEVQDERLARATRRFQIAATPPPLVLDSNNLGIAVVGESYTQQLSASGGVPPYSWSEDAALPAGLVLSADGVLSGSPQSEGIKNVKVKATDSVGVTASGTYKLKTFAPAISLVVGQVDDGSYGSNFGTDQHEIGAIARFQGQNTDLVLTLFGFDIDYSDEVAVYLNDALLGYLQIGPDDALNESDIFTIAASEQLPGTNELRFEQATPGFVWGITDLLVTDLQLTTSSVPDAVFGSDYDTQLEVEGGSAPYSWELVDGSLPQGLALTATGELTGRAADQGTFRFTIAVTDADGKTTPRRYALTVVSTTGEIGVVLHPGIIDTTRYGWKYGTNAHELRLDVEFIGFDDELVLQVTGYDIDYTDEVEVELNGHSLGYLSLSPNDSNNAGDRFSISPELQQAGANRLSFKQRTKGYRWGVTNLLLSNLRIVSPAPAQLTFLENASFAFQASGGQAPYTWQLASGVLPTGMTLSTDGVLFGAPGEQGSFAIDIEVTDANGARYSQREVLAVVGTSGTFEVVLEPGVQDLGQYGWNWGSSEHEHELYVRFYGGTEDLVLRLKGYDIDYDDEVQVIVNGAEVGYLSKGADNKLNQGDEIQIPLSLQQAGLNTVLFRQPQDGFKWGVTDLLLSTLWIPTTTLPAAQYELPYNEQLLVSGGSAPYVWSIISGALPAGITLDAQTGILSGTATEQGIVPLTVQVEDGNGKLANRALELSVFGASGSVEVILTPGIEDTNRYGWRYGNDAHESGLHVIFAGSGEHMRLSVTGFDIDYDDEVQVFLNDTSLGYLSEGPNGKNNAGDSFELPVTLQVSTSNVLYFKQLTPGFVWGVTNMLVEPSAPPVAIETQALPDAEQGMPYDQMLEASGGTPPFSWRVAEGQLPLGLSLDPSGQLSGTALEQGLSNITFEVSDSAASTALVALDLKVVGGSGSYEIQLEVGNTDEGHYGRGYGSDAHDTLLLARFVEDGRDYLLDVIGFDIESASEVEVQLNGTPIGHLKPGGVNANNEGDRFRLDNLQLLDGENAISFVAAPGTDVWGVHSLLLQAVDLPLVDLDINTPDSGQYGNGFGSDEHPRSVDATFVSDGNDLNLMVTGYDIGSASEVEVFLNQRSLGFLNVTPAGALGSEQIFSLPVSWQRPGENMLHFVQQHPGDSWGLRDLNLSHASWSPIALAVDEADSGQYGNGYGSDQHSLLLLSEFTYSTGDLQLSVTGFDISHEQEVEVRLNGAHLGYLSPGAAGAINSGDQFLLPASRLLQGTNELRFIAAQENTIWGVSDLLIATIDSSLVVLEQDQVDSTKYGNRFGTNQHEAELIALFAGGERDLALQLQGYDIDYSDELAVYLNGHLLGHLRKGRNNTYNNGDAIQLPLSLQQPGINEIRFAVKTVGWIWGIRNLHLRDAGPQVPLSLGVIDDSQYGHKYGSDLHPVELVATFEGTSGSLRFDVTGFDIDFSDEIALYLNDELLGHLQTGPNNGDAPVSSFTLDAQAQQSGTNQLRFVQKIGGMPWGVKDLFISPAQ